jgi:hypothetical protein
MFKKSPNKQSILDLPDDLIRCVLSEYLDNMCFVHILRLNSRKIYSDILLFLLYYKNTMPRACKFHGELYGYVKYYDSEKGVKGFIYYNIRSYFL